MMLCNASCYYYMLIRKYIDAVATIRYTGYISRH